MQVTIGRTEILSVNRPKRDNFPCYIMYIKEFQHRYPKMNIKQLCTISPLFETRENSHVQLHVHIF